MTQAIQEISKTYQYSLSMNLQDTVLAFRDQEVLKNPGTKVHFCRRLTATLAMGVLLVAQAIEALVRSVITLFAVPTLYFSESNPEMQHKRMYWIDSAIDHWKELSYRFDFAQKGLQEAAFSLEPNFIQHKLERSLHQAFRRIEIDRFFALIGLRENTMFATIPWLDVLNNSPTIRKTEKALLKSMHVAFKSGNFLMRNAKTTDDFQKTYRLVLQFSEALKNKSMSKMSELFELFSQKQPFAFKFSP